MRLLFEAFSQEDLEQKWAISQIVDFEYEECFMQPLLKSLNADEAHLVYLMDQDLRMMEHYEPKYPYIVDILTEE